MPIHNYLTGNLNLAQFCRCIITRDTQHDIFNAMGAMYAAVLFIGITNATSVQPVISIERFVSYRERAAGMYSALPFAFSLVISVRVHLLAWD